MVWLNPVVDLLRDLFFQGFSLHDLLVYEDLLNEDLCEAFLKLVVGVPHGWRVLTIVNFGAARRGTVFTRSLVPMAHIQPEHQLVGDLIQEGYVRPKLGIARLKLVSQLDLDKLVELFSSLAPI